MAEKNFKTIESKFKRGMETAPALNVQYIIQRIDMYF